MSEIARLRCKEEGLREAHGTRKPFEMVEREAGMPGSSGGSMEDVEIFRIPEMDEAAACAAPDREVSSRVDMCDGVRNESELMRDLERLHCVVEGVNPHFDPFKDDIYARNCGACALATELRFTGRDSKAVAGAFNIASVSEMERITGRVQVALNPDEIEAFAEAQPPGFITVMGMDFRAGNGHWVNLARMESGAYVLDGQSGRIWSFGEYRSLMGPYVSRWDIGVERGDTAAGKERVA